jgi:beta-1,4-N-acetylglucosaminyltransferase
MPRGAKPQPHRVFVTVGTTSFDALARAIDDPRVVDALVRKGFTGLTMQIGRGTYRPQRITNARAFDVEIVDYLPSIEDEIARAALVISHAGAGSVFETLRSGRPLLVVVNETLMDNHQRELAEELAERQHLRWCLPEGLLRAIEAFADDGSAFEFVRYEPGECTIAAVLDELLF